MKIIHLIPELATGGAENSIAELVNASTSKNHNKIWVFKNIIDHPIVDKFDSSVKIKSFSKKSSLLFLLKLIRSTWQEDPDVIHAHLTPSLYPLLLLSVLHRRSKKFFTLHYEKFNIQNPILKIFYQFILPISGIKFFTLSEGSKTELQSFLKMKKRIYLLPNGLAEKTKTSLFKEAEKEIENLKTDSTKVFISVGRIVEIKNFPLLLNVFSTLYDEKQNAILIILGTPPAGREDILDHLKAQKPKNVHFLGNRSNVTDYLLLSDFYCCSSFSEGLPMSIIEALSCKLPIISTSYKNASMVLENGKNGYITNSFEMEDYITKVRMLLNLSKSDYESFSKHSYVIFKENYHIAKISKRYQHILNE